MKPDWQNKSYAKSGSPTAPSTMHSKLKVGMTSLHSKITVSNHNTVQAKPAVRKFADGGSVRTRSDDEIGDTNPRTGVVDPGSYDRRMKAGEENMTRLKSAAESIRSFFSREKGGDASPSNIIGESGMSESDTAKKQAMSGGMDFEKKAEPKIEPVAEPSYKQDVVKAITQPKATVQDLAPVAEPMPTEKAKPVAAKPAKKAAAPDAKDSSSRSMSATPSQSKETAAQMREKQIRASGGSRGARVREAATDTGDEMARLRDRTTKTIPGVVGRFDLSGNKIPVGLGPRSSQVYDGDGSSFMDRSEKKYLQSRIDAGNMTAMEKAQAKRAGLL